MGEIIEVGTVEQLEQVRSLLRRYQSELPPPYRFPDSEWQNLPGNYRPPGGALLLATVTGQPAGCVGLRRFPLESACEMKRLYVQPEFRGAKLGVTLIERIIQVPGPVDTPACDSTLTFRPWDLPWNSIDALASQTFRRGRHNG